jgi:GNAT superfamily N-acetyltransferase
MGIRCLKKSDVVEYRRLRLEALQKAPAAFASSYEEEKKLSLPAFLERLTGESSHTFGAFVKDRLIGILTLLRESRQKQTHQAVLVGMYVSAAYQKQGIGAALVDEAIAFARKARTIRYLKLSVMAGHEAARSLYLSRGFKTFGMEREALYVDGSYLDEEYMVLFLLPAAKGAAPRPIYRQSVQ